MLDGDRSNRRVVLQFAIDPRKRLPDLFGDAYALGNTITTAAVDFGKVSVARQLSIPTIALRIREAVDRYTTREEILRYESAHRALTRARRDLFAPRAGALTLFVTNFVRFGDDLRRNNDLVDFIHSLPEARKTRLGNICSVHPQHHDGGFSLNIALQRSTWCRVERALVSL